MAHVMWAVWEGYDMCDRLCSCSVMYKYKYHNNINMTHVMWTVWAGYGMCDRLCSSGVIGPILKNRQHDSSSSLIRPELGILHLPVLRGCRVYFKFSGDILFTSPHRLTEIHVSGNISNAVCVLPFCTFQV